MKSRTTAIILCLICGIHHIYLGQIGRFILFFLTCCLGVGVIWWIIDLIKLIMMSDEQFNEKFNK